MDLRMDAKIAKAIKRLIRKKQLQPTWEKLLKLSLYGLNNGPIDVYENGEFRYLESMKVTNKPVVFDIGANTGDYASAVMEVFPEAVLYCFEPSKKTFDQLSKKIGNRAKLVNKGCGENPDNKYLYYNEDNSPLASIYKRDLSEYGIKHDHSGEEIEIISLDGWCKENNIGNIDLLKIDTEGNELSALKGCLNLIQNNKIKRIQFEHGACAIASRTFLKDFFDLLCPKFNLFRLVENGKIPLNSYREHYEKLGLVNIVAEQIHSS